MYFNSQLILICYLLISTPRCFCLFIVVYCSRELWALFSVVRRTLGTYRPTLLLFYRIYQLFLLYRNSASMMMAKL